MSRVRLGLVALLALLMLLPIPLRPAAAHTRIRGTVDRILVVKHERRLYLLRDGQPLLSFRIALGRNPRGPKIREGDGRTPEGLYFVAGFKPDSAFYKAIRISYPNRRDIERARRLGVDPGGAIMIHGLDPAIDPALRRDHWRFNWTNGCIAVTDEEMDVLWQVVRWGTPVEIRP